jgi:hypothetical protein
LKALTWALKWASAGTDTCGAAEGRAWAQAWQEERKTKERKADTLAL